MLRKRTRHDHSILVVHTDVPDNDFTAMFRTLSDDPDSYLHNDAATFASAVGRSFYQPDHAVEQRESRLVVHGRSNG